MSIRRTIAVVVGAAALAAPAGALAHQGQDHGSKQAKKEAKSTKRAAKKVMWVFKGVYNADGSVKVAAGNSRVRKAGLVGKEVAFDFAAAKLRVAEADGVPGITIADVTAGDVVLVQAKLPRNAKAEDAPFAARKLIDKTHPPVSDDDAAPAPAPAP